MTTVTLWLEEPLPLGGVQTWMDTLLWESAAVLDIFRVKGLLCIAGSGRKHGLQVLAHCTMPFAVPWLPHRAPPAPCLLSPNYSTVAAAPSLLYRGCSTVAGAWNHLQPRMTSRVQTQQHMQLNACFTCVHVRIARPDLSVVSPHMAVLGVGAMHTAKAAASTSCDRLGHI